MVTFGNFAPGFIIVSYILGKHSVVTSKDTYLIGSVGSWLSLYIIHTYGRCKI